MPVSSSALEMSFLGTEREELAIIPFFYRPCNVQSSVQGMRSMFIMYTFCDLHTHSMFAVSGVTLGKGFTLPRHEVDVSRARNEKSYPVSQDE